MKICSRKNCKYSGILQNGENFDKRKKSKDGLDSWCKECKKQYRLDNKEYFQKYQKEYSITHANEIKEKKKKYNAENVEIRRAREKEYRKNHKKERQEYSKKYNKINKEKIKERHLLRTYSLTLDNAKTIYEAQNKKCIICNEDIVFDTKNCIVDHDHITGQIRGLLCRKCNFLLGNARDKESILLSAILYLRKFSAYFKKVEEGINE